MNLKLIILTATIFAKAAICNAQAGELYSPSKEANSSYIKALDYIKIGTAAVGSRNTNSQSEKSLVVGRKHLTTFKSYNNHGKIDSIIFSYLLFS